MCTTSFLAQLSKSGRAASRPPKYIMVNFNEITLVGTLNSNQRLRRFHLATDPCRRGRSQTNGRCRSADQIVQKLCKGQWNERCPEVHDVVFLGLRLEWKGRFSGFVTVIRRMSLMICRWSTVVCTFCCAHPWLASNDPHVLAMYLTEVLRSLLPQFRNHTLHLLFQSTSKVHGTITYR
jgi:hypothetical protein